MSKEHKDRVTKLCSGGVYFTDIKKNESWDYLKKYSENEVWKVCEAGYQTREAGLRAIESGTSMKASDCPSGKLCPVITMQATRPCLHSDGLRCCKYEKGKGHKECRNAQEAGKSNFNYLDSRWSQEDKAKYGNNEVVPWSGCDYVARVMDNGKWVCPKQYQHGTGVENLSGINQVSSDQRKRQCAKTQTCADKLKQHYRTNPIVPAAANSGQGQGAPVAPSSPGVVQAWRNSDKTGGSETFPELNKVYNLADLGFDNTISSISVPAGRKVTLYQKKDAGGYKLALNAGEHKLTTFAFPSGVYTPDLTCDGGNNNCWNDSASSVKVEAA